MIGFIKQWLAKQKLARDRKHRLSSFAVQDYAKRRAAMLKHTRAA